MFGEEQKMQKDLKYKRILLKLSGEALSAGAGGILDHAFIGRIATVVKKCTDSGAEVAIIVGAGNIWRGRQGLDMDPVRADHMGMLATAINALGLQDGFAHAGIDCRVMTAVEMPQFAELYVPRNAIAHLSAGRVVILGCGTGLPFFSTDTAAALRAAELKADMILMAKNIDGIYTADPKLDPSARKLNRISYAEIMEQNLRAIDTTATVFCREHAIPLLVFGLSDPENIYRAVMGEEIGTVVHESNH